MRDNTMGASEAMILASYYGESAMVEILENADEDWVYNTAALAAHYALLYVEITEEYNSKNTEFSF